MSADFNDLEDFTSLDHLVPVLQQLVRIPSINPGGDERAVVERIRQLLDGTGVEMHVVEHEPGRPSLAAVLPGKRGGPTLVLNGHTDTVPIDDENLWTTKPFEAEVRDGFIYGRGACDMKAGLAIAIGILRNLARDVPAEQRGTLIAHFAAGEERGEPGTLALVEAGHVGDYGIVMEPTCLQVATATRGVGRYTIRVKGRAGHASKPEYGRNPIWAVSNVIGALEEYRAGVGSVTHPMLPSGTCTPTVVRAGASENAIPDWCDILVDRRLVPGESAVIEGQRLNAHLQKAAAAGLPENVEIEMTTLLAADPAEIDADSPFALLTLQCLKDEVGGSPVAVGMPFGSDTRNLVNEGGMQALTFGPGDIGECHCADERLSLDEFSTAARVLTRVTKAVLIDGVLDGASTSARQEVLR